LCALDAEFISTKEEEVEIRADGTKRVIKPAQLTLARVSVVRGWGSREGVAFIDDYIHVKEPVIDYLTKFSGINPGDLDPAISPHSLTTRKVFTTLFFLSPPFFFFFFNDPLELVLHFSLVGIHEAQAAV